MRAVVVLLSPLPPCTEDIRDTAQKQRNNIFSSEASAIKVARYPPMTTRGRRSIYVLMIDRKGRDSDN
jgi:hypothetical protein